MTRFGPPPCETCGAFHPGVPCMLTHPRVSQRLEWWRRDLAYKAPEQVDKEYAAALIADLARAVDKP